MIVTLTARVEALAPAQQASLLDFIAFLEWKASDLPYIKDEARDALATAMAKRLREVREAMGANEEQAAEVARVSVHTYVGYERRGPRRWGTGKMTAYAEDWNVSLDWLYDGTGNMFCGGRRPVRRAAAADSNVVVFKARARAEGGDA